jgi:hypothetical protein
VNVINGIKGIQVTLRRKRKRKLAAITLIPKHDPHK